MITVEGIERKILNLEHFKIKMLHLDGSDARSDLRVGRRYGKLLAAKGSYTVENWKQNRFKKRFPEFDCEVLKGDGSPAHGLMRLDNLRATY